MDEERTPPVVVGDEITVEIEAFGDKNDPLAKVDGYTIIIKTPDTNTPLVQWESYEVKITNTRDTYAFAELI